MIIDIIVILKVYLRFLFNRKRGCPYSVPMSEYVYVQCTSYTPFVIIGVYTCVIIRTPYIPLDKLYIMYEPIR